MSDHRMGFDIQSPYELLMLLDEGLRTGRDKLHPWQKQILMDFADGDRTDSAPYQALVRACNGSGKDKYVIAPCVVWLCMRYKRARCVVTSSSGKQLDSQTCTYIDLLCNEANRVIGPIWKLNYRYYECLATGSPVECFATDEAGKAEGFHPLESGCKMALFMSEAKTVPDEVNTAFNKCTGYTHRVHVSTPGLPLGHFFEYCNRSPERKNFKSVRDCNPVDYVQYHVTAYDCSHLSKVYIEQMKRDLPGGEFGAAFRSQVMAEFGTTDEMVVIPSTFIWRAVNDIKVGHHPEPYPTGGLDLSAGGDETVFCVRNGNKQLACIPFRFQDTQMTVEFLEQKFSQYGFKHPQARIWADAGGLGRPIIDQLRQRGWANIRYVLNQERAFRDTTYKNRGTEMWFNFAKLLEGGEVWLLNDDKQNRQLAARYYKISTSNIHQLESKLEARSKGHPSPDRGDALVLCYCDYKNRTAPPEFERPFELPKPPVNPRCFDAREWAKEETSDKSVLNPSRNKNFRVYRAEIARINEQRRQKKDQINEPIQM